MKKEDLFSNSEILEEEEIKKRSRREFPLPENVEMAKQNAFAKIRSGQMTQEVNGKLSENQRQMQEVNEKLAKSQRQSQVAYFETRSGKKTEKKSQKRSSRARVYFRGLIGAAAGVAVFSTVCITNPALAEKIPLVGHVFEELGESLGFSGDFEEYAEPLTEKEMDGSSENRKDAETDAQEVTGESEEVTRTSAYSMTQNGMTVTLSEVYCNDMALYISMVIETEEEFPETVTMYNSDVMLLSIINSTLKFDYNDHEKIGPIYLDGKQVDEHTYAGVLRYDMQESADATDYEDKKEFTVELTIPQISGTKVDGQEPEMPEDIRAEYEAAMAENGLGLTDEDYANFTEEQKDIECRLFNEMWNAYAERYPETRELINPYLEWCVEGPWTFTLDVKKDDSQTIVKEIYDVDENNIGLETVTKTPFEIVVDDSGYVDGFTVVLDADGNPLDGGNTGGSTNILAINGRDVSKIDVFICDWTEYMDEIKGYPLGDDYEERKKTKTYKQLLEERALYHKEIVF